MIVSRISLARISLAATVAATSACGSGLAQIEASALPETVAPASAPTISATWMGTAGIMLDDGTTAILIDPFVSRPSLGRVGFGRPIPVDDARVDLWMKMPGIDRAKAVVVTHSHYDHVMDAPAFAKRTEATVVGSASTAAIARASGLPDPQIVTAALHAPMQFGDFTVTMLPSRHGRVLLGRVPYPGTVGDDFTMPAKAKDYSMGGAFTVVVEHPAGTVVHHASAGWVPGMLDDVAADVVFLGLAGHRDPSAYIDAVVDTTGADRIVPIHWDNFFRGFDAALQPLRSAHVTAFFDHVADTRPDLRLETLPLGQARIVLTGDG